MAENNQGNVEASAVNADARIATAAAETPAVVVVADTPDSLDTPALKAAKVRKSAAPVARAVPPRKSSSAVAQAPVSATPVADKAVELKSSAAKLAATKPLPAVEPTPEAAAAPQPAASPAPFPKAALESAAPTTQPNRLSLFSAKPKEKIMETTSTYADNFKQKTAAYADNFKQKITETQGKAKDAIAKGRAALGEVGEFSRGNVDAVVASGKILVAGLRDIRSTAVAERRSAVETLKADFKDLAAVKTPTDFFKLQGEIARKNLDSVVATGSKNSEAVLKLTREALAPISGRLSLAVEKVKAARA